MSYFANSLCATTLIFWKPKTFRSDFASWNWFIRCISFYPLHLSIASASTGHRCYRFKWKLCSFILATVKSMRIPCTTNERRSEWVNESANKQIFPICSCKKKCTTKTFFEINNSDYLALIHSLYRNIHITYQHMAARRAHCFTKNFKYMHDIWQQNNIAQLSISTCHMSRTLILLIFVMCKHHLMLKMMARQGKNAVQARESRRKNAHYFLFVSHN